MGQPTAIFHAAEQQRRAIRQQRCARVEDAVDGIRPVLTRQNRVCGMAMKYWLEECAQQAGLLFYGYGHKRISFSSGHGRARISRSAIKNDSVDSAPWFSFARSGCRPSRQPPVAES